MSLEKLKQHAQSQLESLADKKALLLKRLGERGVLHSGYSIIPDLAEVELREVDWNDITKIIEHIEEKGEGEAGFITHIEKRVAYEMERHCDYVPLPSSSSAINNYIEAMQLAHKPKRWELFQSVIEMAKKDTNQ